MKTIKTSVIVAVYNLLKSAKLGDMATADKFNVIKSIKALKVIAEDFETFRTDASEKLKGDNHEAMQQKAWEWRDKGDKATLTDDEKLEVNAYFDKYAKDLGECVLEEANKDNEIDIRTINEESFGKFMAANDWNVEQIMTVEEILCE